MVRKRPQGIDLYPQTSDSSTTLKEIAFKTTPTVINDHISGSWYPLVSFGDFLEKYTVVMEDYPLFFEVQQNLLQWGRERKKRAMMWD